MLSLQKARMPELVAALEEEQTLQGEERALPRRARRVARILMTEAIRLIRVGTRAEIADAALELAEALTRPSAERLKELHPAAHRLLTSASDALAAATPPSSGGSEMTLLNPRSWNGKSREAVAILSGSEGRSMPWAELRERLRISKSHLSHMLSELEAAGLVVRVRSGRNVTVHLGVVGRSEHVQKMLPRQERVPPVKAGTRMEQFPTGIGLGIAVPQYLDSPVRISGDELALAFAPLSVEEPLPSENVDGVFHNMNFGVQGPPVTLPGAWSNTETTPSPDVQAFPVGIQEEAVVRPKALPTKG